MHVKTPETGASYLIRRPIKVPRFRELVRVRAGQVDDVHSGARVNDSTGQSEGIHRAHRVEHERSFAQQITSVSAEMALASRPISELVEEFARFRERVIQIHQALNGYGPELVPAARYLDVLQQ